MPDNKELSNTEVEHRHGRSGEPSEWGRRSMSPNARAMVGVVMGVLILLAAIYALLLGFSLLSGSLPSIGWWLLFYGLVIACGTAAPIALRLSKRNFAGARELTTATSATGRDEREAERRILEAIERRGNLTPARAALETTLTVAESDRLLSDLAQKGHLEVRVEGGKLVYTL